MRITISFQTWSIHSCTAAQCQSYLSAFSKRLLQAIIAEGASGIGASYAKELISSNVDRKVVVGDKNIQAGQNLAQICCGMRCQYL